MLGIVLSARSLVARGIKGEKLTWVCGLCITGNLMICTPHQILFVGEGKKNHKGGVSGKLRGEGWRV